MSQTGITFKSKHKSVAAWLTTDEYDQLGRIAASRGTTRSAMIADATREILKDDAPNRAFQFLKENA